MVRARVLGGAAVFLAGSAITVAQQPQPQRVPPPNWLDDDGKDMFVELESEDKVYGDNACELREKLLKKMAGSGEKDAADHRFRVLLGLGFCSIKKEDYPAARKRVESALSELNVPSEDYLLKSPQTANLPLIKQAAIHLSRHELSQAGTALRRCREVTMRNLKNIVKAVHKQIPAGQAPPLQQMLDEIPGLGKTGQFLPMIIPQVPMLGSEFAQAQLLEEVVDNLDRRLATIDPTLKDKRLRLESKGKVKGSLMYTQMLPSEAVVPAERSGAVQEFISNGGLEALKSEVALLEKGATLVKRAKEGSGCKEGLKKTCKALQKVPDIASNVFGETRVVIVKATKQQVLDVCNTNANIAILIAAKDGATAKIKGHAEAIDLKAGEPVVVDYCREVTLEASAGVPVLFSQVWHPEFAALERSTEIRARSKAFSLSEDDVKDITKIVNDAAKKSWEKTANLWRQDSEMLAAIKAAFEASDAAKSRQKEQANEAKRLEEEANDEERKKALEQLERKRAEKRKKQEEAEQARLKRKKQLEEERAKRDPWLNFPSVLEAEKRLEELKEARRDANAKLEFDLSTSLTKEISAAERDLKKATKKAKKLHKKGGTAEDDVAAQSTKESNAGAKKDSPELKKLREQLEKTKKKKQDAVDKEDFKQAKRLKEEQDKLESKIQKLEL